MVRTSTSSRTRTRTRTRTCTRTRTRTRIRIDTTAVRRMRNESVSEFVSSEQHQQNFRSEDFQFQPGRLTKYLYLVSVGDYCFRWIN